jgi:hypothetical protein
MLAIGICHQPGRFARWLVALAFLPCCVAAQTTGKDSLCTGDQTAVPAAGRSFGYVAAAPVTTVLPAEGDARIVFNRPLDRANPQRFIVLEPTQRNLPTVESVETTTEKILKDYPANESVLLHVNIPDSVFPLWHRREFLIVECSAEKFRSWAQVHAYVSSRYVGLFCIPIALLTYVLAISSVYVSRKQSAKKQNAEGRLAEKYPSVFAAKEFETVDFFNPIQLTANAFSQASVQKLQVLMFSFLVGCLVLYLVLRTGTLADMSGTVVALLGISGVGAAVSQMTYTSKTRLSFDNWAWLQSNSVLKVQAARAPQWKDLVLTNREFDVYKLQTIIFSLAVAAALVVTGASGLATFQIPSAMLGVLGLSQVVFVGGILVRPPATEDLDDTLTTLRAAAGRYSEALARGTDVDADGKLIDSGVDSQHVAQNAKRQYEHLVELAIPMIESTLEVEVDKNNLLQAPRPVDERNRSLAPERANDIDPGTTRNTNEAAPIGEQLMAR